MSIAAPSAIGGNQIPLSQLSPLLGQETETLLSSQRLANEAAWTQGFRLTGQPVNVSEHDSIRIAVVSSGGVLVEEWNVDVNDWKQLTGQSVGDDLAQAGRSIILRSDTGTIRIGRSTGNRILLQLGTYTTVLTDFNLNGYARSYGGGLLERRIAPSRSHPVRDTVLKIRSASEPADPVGVTFDADGVATPGSDGYVLVTDADPSGTDPIWLAAAHNPYDPVTETYVPEAWVKTLGGTAYRQQWASDETGPWLDSPDTLANAQRLVSRVRVNGVWQIYVIRDNSYVPWTLFVAATMPAGSTQPFTTALRNQDWRNFRMMELILHQGNGTARGNRLSLLVPADYLYSSGNSASSINNDLTMNLLMSEYANAWSLGDTDPYAGVIVPSIGVQTFRMNFYGCNERDNRATHLRVTVGYTQDRTQFYMRGY